MVNGGFFISYKAPSLDTNVSIETGELYRSVREGVLTFPKLKLNFYLRGEKHFLTARL